jgi:hypothetical protein
MPVARRGTVVSRRPGGRRARLGRHATCSIDPCMHATHGSGSDSRPGSAVADWPGRICSYEYCCCSAAVQRSSGVRGGASWQLARSILARIG